MNVGIIGAGQLARMLALAGHPLGISCHCAANQIDDSAGGVALLSVIDLHDDKALKTFCDSVDVVTFENENVDAAIADKIAALKPLYPGIKALKLSQDRLHEKQGLSQLDIPVAPYADVTSLDDLKKAVDALGLPAILKTRRFGYDGKGQYVLKSMQDCEKAWDALGGQALILEGFVKFDREVSIIAVRRVNGDTVFYPLVENTHQDGVLRESKIPFKNDQLQTLAEDYATRLLTQVNYVGVLAIEFFVMNDTLIANEFAPRVHNTGHLTIEASNTSQFENHVRAILDLPLGSTDTLSLCVMTNCIGEMPDAKEILKNSKAHYHDYKKSPREGRKLGHITLID